MYIRRYDVATAYLNGELDEEVYMEVPDRMEEIYRPHGRVKGPSGYRGDQHVEGLGGRRQSLSHEQSIVRPKASRPRLEQTIGQRVARVERKSYKQGPLRYVRHQKEILIIIIYVDDLLMMYRPRGSRLLWARVGESIRGKGSRQSQRLLGNALL